MTARRKKTVRLPTPSALEDAWQRQAMRAAIEKARAVVSGGAVPTMTPIGRLSDTEWGWIVAAVLFAWVRERATQATSNGIRSEEAIHSTSLEPDPWDAGAITTVLPELGNVKVDWNASLAELSREEMITFLGDAFALIKRAIQARDVGKKLVTKAPPDATAAGCDAPWDDGVPVLS